MIAPDNGRSPPDDSPSRPYLLALVEQLAAQISIQNIKAPKMPKLEIINL